MIRLYMDENVIRAISRGLRQRGVDILTVIEDNRAGIADPKVLDRATELDRVLFTHDDDFLRESAVRVSTQQHFVRIIYAHQNRISIFLSDNALTSWSSSRRLVIPKTSLIAWSIWLCGDDRSPLFQWRSFHFSSHPVLL
jgi:predicted nuclease of predicted toxin-antitoxin system